MNKNAEEIMSKTLITVTLDDTVEDAYALMVKHRIRHLPVTEDSGSIVGILSDRDVQRCVRYDRKNRSTELDIGLSLDPSVKVVDAMSWPAHQIDGDTPVGDVARRMLDDKISSLIVRCPKTGRHGIITTDDMLRILISLQEKDPSRLRVAVDSFLTDLYPVTASLSTAGI